MMLRQIVLACLAGLLTAFPASTAGASGHREFAVAEAPVLDDRLIAEPIVFANGVRMWRDVTYQQLPGYRPQIVDIYVPQQSGPHPLIMYIHGGGWRGGHTRHSGALADFPQVLADLAAEGFVVASLEYRLSAEAKYPAQLQDAKAALRFLAANAQTYRIDPARIGLWGGSAGGHLAALTALTCRNIELDPASAGDPCISAAVIWYGVFDFARMIERSAGGNDDAIAQLLGCMESCAPDRIAAASPMNFINQGDPPFLLIHGIDDRVVPVDQSRMAQELMLAAGVPVEAIYIPGVDHSFIGQTAQETREATVRATNATFDFFHAHLIR